MNTNQRRYCQDDYNLYLSLDDFIISAADIRILEKLKNNF